MRPEHVDALGESARYDHGAAAEHGDRAGERGAERGAGFLQAFARDWVAGARRRNQLRVRRRDRGPRAIASKAGPAAWRSSHPWTLSPASSGSAQAQPNDAAAPPVAAHDPPVRQHRRTDAGADRDENGVPDVAGRAQGRFGEEREVGVVAERHGHTREQTTQILTIEIGEVRDPCACGPRREARYRQPDARCAVRRDQVRQPGF